MPPTSAKRAGSSGATLAPTQPEVVARTHTKRAPLYEVWLWNDEETPMDFVVSVLTKVFSLAQLDAWKVMYEAHHSGRALVETVSQATAKAHLRRAHTRARAAGYPLRFTMNRR